MRTASFMGEAHAWQALRGLPQFHASPDTANQWIACCPAHEDRHPSLSITENEDGRVLMKCHAGCTFEQICEALHRDKADFFPPRANTLQRTRAARRLKCKVTEYPYIDETDALVGNKERTDYIDSAGKPYRPKIFRWKEHNGRGAREMPLYGLPRLRAAKLGSVVVLTEGEKAADALLDVGVLAVSIATGAGAIPYDAVLRALLGYDVALWADHDAVGVRCMQQIAARLTALGNPPPRWVVWPEAPEKGDAADWVACGGTAEALPRFLSTQPPDVPDTGRPAHASAAAATTTVAGPVPDAEALHSDQAVASDAPASEYFEAPAGLFWRKRTQNGTVPIHLANFTARIVTDICESDGVESRRLFEIAATLAGRASRFVVPAERFSAMTWPTEHLGAGAILSPGQGIKERARHAIQVLSTEIREDTVHTHTGWLKTEPHAWVFLHAGGAIGADGPVPHVHVALPDPLIGMSLPDPPTGADLQAKVRLYLDHLLSLAPLPLVAALLAGVYRAPLGGRADYSLWLAGQTGAGKSVLAALMQQHYGPGLDHKHLPIGWESTDNALEGLAFAAKDTLLVIDDFAPTGSSIDIQRLHSKADRVLRAQANGTGRMRMRADASLRPAKPPRGLLLGTGEDVPRGQSLRARLCVLQMDHADLDWGHGLALCQDDAHQGLSAEVCAAYIQWLAPQCETLPVLVRTRGAELRSLVYRARGAHRRTPELTADQMLSIELFFRFTVAVGALSVAEAETYRIKLWDALASLTQQQDVTQAESDPVRRFRDLLLSAISAGDAYLAARDGTKPGTDEDPWGWREKAIGMGEHLRLEWQAQGKKVGWLDQDDLYLDRQSAYAVVQRLAQSIGEPIPITESTMGRRMHDQGLLASTEPSRETTAVRRRLEGQDRLVLHLKLQTFLRYGEPDKPDNAGAEPRQNTETLLSGLPSGSDSPYLTTTPTTTPAENQHANAAVVGFVGSVTGEREVRPVGQQIDLPTALEPVALAWGIADGTPKTASDANAHADIIVTTTPEGEMTWSAQ